MKQLGPDHVDVATSYNNLGTICSDPCVFQRAKDSFARACRCTTSYNNLGTVYSALGDFQQVKDGYTCALDIYVK